MTNPLHHKRFPRVRTTTTLALTGALLFAGPAVADAASPATFGVRIHDHHT